MWFHRWKCVISEQICFPYAGAWMIFELYRNNNVECSWDIRRYEWRMAVCALDKCMWLPVRTRMASEWAKMVVFDINAMPPELTAGGVRSVADSIHFRQMRSFNSETSPSHKQFENFSVCHHQFGMFSSGTAYSIDMRFKTIWLLDAEHQPTSASASRHQKLQQHRASSIHCWITQCQCLLRFRLPCDCRNRSPSVEFPFVFLVLYAKIFSISVLCIYGNHAGITEFQGFDKSSARHKTQLSCYYFGISCFCLRFHSLCVATAKFIRFNSRRLRSAQQFFLPSICRVRIYFDVCISHCSFPLFWFTHLILFVFASLFL